MNHRADHVWHVWINSESEHFGTRPSEMPIEPHGRNLYDFKSAIHLIPWLTKAIGKERTNSLPMVHQQCSHSAPERLEENYLQCGLGQRLSSCPILARLRSTFDEYRKKEYYDKITDEDVDEVQSLTCVWHMLMGSHGYVDWNEGAVQDCSDRKFWANVYENLSQGD